MVFDVKGCMVGSIKARLSVPRASAPHRLYWKVKCVGRPTDYRGRFIASGHVAPVWIGVAAGLSRAPRTRGLASAQSSAGRREPPGLGPSKSRPHTA